MTADKQITLLNEVKKVLHYYAAFKHPLDLKEVHFNCLKKCSKEESNWAVTTLLQEKEIYAEQGYYTISKDVAKWVERRKKGEKQAKRILPLAIRYGKFIAGFPFVRFVGISGSLSKGYADQKSDFDFFIITSGNRLWLSRTLLHLVKKLSFLFGLQDRFCMNYFVDEDHCEIEEQNLYTAIELSSLKAVSGKNHYHHLMEKNQWRKHFLPNEYRPFFGSEHIDENNPLFKRGFECLLNPLGNRLNRYLMKLTDRKWRKKWKRKNYPAEDYELAFKTTLHHSKNHPANYQKKVLLQVKKFQTSNA